MQSHDPGDPIEVIVPGIQPENALRVIAPPPELPIYLVQVPERLICRFCHEQALDEGMPIELNEIENNFLVRPSFCSL